MTRRLLSILVSSLFLVAAGAQAQTAPAATGITGPVDLNWEVSIDNGTTWFQAFKVINPAFPASGFIPPNWEPNTLEYAWISATTTGTGGGGDYLFRTFFDLTGFFGTSLMFQCVVDNLPEVGQYSLNGSAFMGTCGHQDLYDFTAFQNITSGFNSGINELLFHVTGDSQTDGLLVGNVDLEASLIPEPASMVLLGTGLVAVFGAVARRRRNARGV